MSHPVFLPGIPSASGYRPAHRRPPAELYWARGARSGTAALLLRSWVQILTPKSFFVSFATPWLPCIRFNLSEDGRAEFAVEDGRDQQQRAQAEEGEDAVAHLCLAEVDDAD